MIGPLCLGLRFRPEFDAEQWQRTIGAIMEWEPTLVPTHVHRRDDPSALPREPWRADLWPELVRRCANEKSWSWGLEHLDTEQTSIDIGRGLHQNDITIAMDPPAGSVTKHVAELLSALQGGASPALGFAYRGSGPDTELAVQGIQRLTLVPPLLYVDRAALAFVGGRQHVLATPCTVSEIPGGGLLLTTRDPLRGSGTTDAADTAAVARWLGIGETTPVAFLASPERWAADD